MNKLCLLLTGLSICVLPVALLLAYAHWCQPSKAVPVSAQHSHADNDLPLLGTADRFQKLKRSFGNHRSDENLEIIVDEALVDQGCQTLFVRARITNKSPSSIFFIANDFTFKNCHNGDYSSVRINTELSRVSVDLSHLTPTDFGMQLLRDNGTLISPPQTIAIPAGESVSYTYSFHFPIWESPELSENRIVELPKGVESVELRFGYAKETLRAFWERNYVNTDDVVSWHDKVAAKWQATIVVEAQLEKPSRASGIQAAKP